MEPSIRSHARQSYQALSLLVTATDPDPTLQGIVEDVHGRFKVWADNIGAFHDQESRASIDSRLRNAPSMRQSVKSGLLRLEDACERARAILSEGPPSPIKEAEPGDDGEDVDATDEMAARREQLLLSIKSAINYLFGLSTIMRRDRPRGRLPPLPQFSEEEASPDITYVADKFPKLRDPASSWLTRRLGNAIAYRRHYIRYRQEHRQRLGASASYAPELEGNDMAAEWVTVATTFAEIRSQDQPLEVPSSSKTGSAVSTATSFISTCDGESIPGLDRLFLEGVQLRYGEPFECPFCRTIQTLGNEQDWRRHVFNDLQPYVCTAEDCSSHLFKTMHEWMDHDLNTHHREWRCPICSRGATPFSSCDKLEQHLLSHHHATGNQASILARNCKSQATPNNQPAVCQFCPAFDNASTSSAAEFLTTTPRVVVARSKDYYRHVAAHQQQLALQSIPLSIDGLEVEEEADEASVVDDGPPTPSQPFFPDDGPPNVAIRDDSASLCSKTDPQVVTQPKLPTCKECGRTFNLPHQLNHHKRYHERPHICEHVGCGKRFGTKTHLDRHTADKHNQIRRYYCSIPTCAFSKEGGKGFPRKDNFRRHMMNCHGDSLPTSVVGAPAYDDLQPDDE